MSADRIERDLAELPDAGGARAGWEARVLATVRTDTARVTAMARPTQRHPLTFALAGGCAVALATILFFVLRPDPQAAREKAAAERMDRVVQQLEETLAEVDRLNRETEARHQALLAADTEEEKAAAQHALDLKMAELLAKQSALRTLRDRSRAPGAAKTGPAEQERRLNVKCDPNDPLCGI